MKLPFLDRTRELSRLRRRLRSAQSSLVCLYGRRRCGKSRLIREALAGLRHVYYVADEREDVLQRRAMAQEMARLVPGMDAVEYPGWQELLDQFWRQAPRGAVLAIDEFPYLVGRAPELPSLLQKRVDAPSSKPRHTILCGSSQRMMLGLLLDARAPLYGRAQEILKVEPLPAPELGRALSLKTAREVVDHFAVFGGVPRYWELAADLPGLRRAITDLVLDPMGVLHQEPERLLMDDLRDTAQASSILSLIGAGCHRLSEIAGRLGHPGTSLSRPLSRLIEMGLVHREVPFGSSPKDSKRSFYRISDPFLAFYYRHVAPNRSRLGAGQAALVGREIEDTLPQHIGEVFEDLVRSCVAHMRIAGARYEPGTRFWGNGLDGHPLEIDVVARAVGPERYLAAEVKRSLSGKDAARTLMELQAKVERCPVLAGKQVTCVLFAVEAKGKARSGHVFDAERVLAALEG